MPLTRRHSAAWRRVCLTLAMLALAVKVALPAGFMVAPKSAELPFAMVLCTGEGAMVVKSDGSLHRAGAPAQAPDEKPAHEAPCAFAGNGAAVVAPSLAVATPVAFPAYVAAASPRRADLAPGRGLAAPPPPTRGPPAQRA